MMERTWRLVKEAERLLAAATPGPWRRESGCRIVSDAANIATSCDGGTKPGEQQANEEFIAWCREGVPALIAALDRAEDALADALGAS